MTKPTDRLLAAALGQAGRAFAQEQQNGRLVWKRGADRCYAAQRDGCAVLTYSSSGRTVLTYEVVGVTLEDLR